MSRRRTRSGHKRNYTPYFVVGLVLVTGLVGYYIFEQSGVGAGSPLIGTPVSSTVLNDLNGVTLNTLSIVGTGGVSGTTPPTSISGSNLTLNGKPEVLYIGAEYCPYCGAERWAMIVALDKFGNFSGINYMQSSASDVYPSTPTFTFLNATYTSNYIAFVSVEQETRAEAPLQTATSEQTALMTQYDSGQDIPFIDFGNHFLVEGAQYSPPVLAPANGNWTLIASQLNDVNSTYAANIDGSAASMIAAICQIDGSQPSNICVNSFATQKLAYITTPSEGIQLQISDALSVPTTEAASYSPTRPTYQV